MLKKTFFALILIISLSIVSVGYYVFFTPIITQKTIITIKPHTGLSTIAHDLYKAGIIAHPYLFYISAYMQQYHNKLPAGELVLEPPITLWQLPAKIIKADAHQYKLTLKEGMSVQQILHVMQQADTPLYYDITPPPIEGSLLPETYHFPKNHAASSLVNTMQAQMQAVLKKLPAIPVNHPLQQIQDIVILASLIQKEAANNAEMARIAGVFVNRLRNNMRLQTDPSVIYGLSNYTGNLGRPLLRSDLKKDHPWNTYTRNHLPKTAITNMGIAALEAAILFEEHDYYYFVAGNEGVHIFNKTYQDHLQSIRDIRAN